MNILYVNHGHYDVCLNLDNVTAIQRFNNKIVIHFNNPDQDFTIFDDKEEFEIINDYFKSLAKDRLKLTSFINKEIMPQRSKVDPREFKNDENNEDWGME